MSRPRAQFFLKHWLKILSCNRNKAFYQCYFSKYFVCSSCRYPLTNLRHCGLNYFISVLIKEKFYYLLLPVPWTSWNPRFNIFQYAAFSPDMCMPLAKTSFWKDACLPQYSMIPWLDMCAVWKRGGILAYVCTVDGKETSGFHKSPNVGFDAV